jgi:hypothetical protein
MSIDNRNVLATLIAIVENAGDDGDTADRVEAARDHVRREHVAPLVELYSRLTSWTARRALIELIQDHAVPIALPVMKHFLAGAPSDGSYDHALAAAAAHLDGDLSRFEHYYDVPGSIEAARRSARERGAP